MENGGRKWRMMEGSGEWWKEVENDGGSGEWWRKWRMMEEVENGGGK